VHLTMAETPTTLVTRTEKRMRLFLMTCGTFASNVVGRFHEYADARLAEELTIVEQRRRLLGVRNEESEFARTPSMTHRPAAAARQG